MGAPGRCLGLGSNSGIRHCGRLPRQRLHHRMVQRNRRLRSRRGDVFADRRRSLHRRLHLQTRCRRGVRVGASVGRHRLQPGECRGSGWVGDCVCDRGVRQHRRLRSWCWSPRTGGQRGQRVRVEADCWRHLRLGGAARGIHRRWQRVGGCGHRRGVGSQHRQRRRPHLSFRCGWRSGVGEGVWWNGHRVGGGSSGRWFR